jgi:hypothetical protein
MADTDSARDLMTSAMQCTAALIAIVGGFLASRIVFAERRANNCPRPEFGSRA